MLPADLLYASQLLTHLLGVMIRVRREAARQTPAARERVLASAAYMKDHPDRALDLETLASMAGVSMSHYCALFRALTGQSPKRYFTRVRMIRAQQLLATTADSVKIISDRLGFDDPLYFSRVFRLVHGMSPSEFRRLRQSDDRPC